MNGLLIAEQGLSARSDGQISFSVLGGREQEMPGIGLGVIAPGAFLKAQSATQMSTGHTVTRTKQKIYRLLDALNELVVVQGHYNLLVKHILQRSILSAAIEAYVSAIRGAFGPSVLIEAAVMCDEDMSPELLLTVLTSEAPDKATDLFDKLIDDFLLDRDPIKDRIEVSYSIIV